ncbi:hypothetical protein ODJ79_18640 [Actinoplanes sp. KI2]|uniref:hypothetical protein n=1 Tax=Actinoplanes sp. KI2 TaxID=2983315 RepID=UPI0021D5A802|nr:hypothetical protein [Actinoplanes sp. KI2]MCU7725752.1 hypothetical protein [Actinoplanes sp. KI2]
MTAPRPPRWFVADDILSGRVNLDGYPFRYIYISIHPSITTPFGGTAYAAKVDAVFTAVEWLETRGWEIVNFELSGKVAYLRRSQAP